MFTEKYLKYFLLNNNTSEENLSLLKKYCAQTQLKQDIDTAENDLGLSTENLNKFSI